MSDIFDPEFDANDLNLDANLIDVGADINIIEKDPTLRKINVAMGWDVNAFEADSLDLDLSCFLLDKDYQTRVNEDFVFYNNPEACDGGISQNGDSRTGAGAGDDESISIDLHSIPFDIARVVFFLSIDQGYEREQSLSMVRKAYFRVLNEDGGMEMLRYDLSAHLVDNKNIGMIVAVLDREGPKRHVKTMNEGIAGGLKEIAESYGMVIQGG